MILDLSLRNTTMKEVEDGNVIKKMWKKLNVIITKHYHGPLYFSINFLKRR